MLEVLEGPHAGTEPIGERIIEVAEYPELTALRAPNAGYIAYAPVGSIKKGEALVARGQCVSCHGRDLGGNAPGAPRVKLGLLAPPLAGRSPTYLVRQLYELKIGTRRGVMSRFMRPVVTDLSTLRHAVYRGVHGLPAAAAPGARQHAVSFPLTRLWTTRSETNSKPKYQRAPACECLAPATCWGARSAKIASR